MRPGAPAQLGGAKKAIRGLRGLRGFRTKPNPRNLRNPRIKASGPASGALQASFPLPFFRRVQMLGHGLGLFDFAAGFWHPAVAVFV